jgi:hypothetical protein
MKREDGRRHELEEALKRSLEAQLARMERGMIVEINAEPPPPDNSATDDDRRRPFEEAKRVAGELHFPRMEGTPVLQLPPPPPERPEEPRA